MNPNFHLTPLYQSWTPDERYVYDERICIMCEQGPVTQEAHEAALVDVERWRDEKNCELSVNISNNSSFQQSE